MIAGSAQSSPINLTTRVAERICDPETRSRISSPFARNDVTGDMRDGRREIASRDGVRNSESGDVPDITDEWGKRRAGGKRARLKSRARRALMLTLR
ncbi:hypothetical protein [Burkholderia sp. Ac-20353]|uniref:hypothetical protein n=1 Tax=Burkholderia sp. Ac-20353 TaxID=2703894 RepID=UPI00197C2B4A|nr:hypothetical protein [Burkholderia sp. Ac-20353]MBN3786275.1 hypothetical protein [Burkholderia sp. Ac-20353]